MAIKHTPGPWDFNPHRTIIYQEAPPQMPVAVISTGTISGAYQTSVIKANAKLIAAAPDLIEALEAIKARIDGEFDHPSLMKYGPLSTTTTDILYIIQQAINEATD